MVQILVVVGATGKCTTTELLMLVQVARETQWIISEHACYVYSMLAVPIYNTFGLESVKTVLTETLSVIIIDTIDKLEFLIKTRTYFENLKVVVLMDDIISCRPALKAEADKDKLVIMTMKDIVILGEKDVLALPNMPPKPSSLAAICYTSGTGGSARGVLLTHANFVANCSSMTAHKHMLFTSDDSAVLMAGGSTGFFHGNVHLLGDDLYHLQPTKMACVPSLMNRIYNNAMTRINGSTIGKCLYPKAFASKKRLLEKRIICDDTLWDCLLFRKIRNYFGGKLKMIICGSAPCSSEALTFMRIAMGCLIVEGYGCTENTAAAACTLEGDYETGHVGPPCPCNKIKLIDIPETTTVGSEQAGEICISGPTVFQGYFNDPESTAKVLDKDGWLHTGDVGVWTKRGALKIVGRRNSLFKLSQGEFIAPEKIENVYSRSQFIFQIFVYGDNQHDHLVAIIVPDFNNLKPALQPVLGPKAGSLFEICVHEATITLIKHDMHEKAVAAGLNHTEEVKKITLFPEPFTVENGLVTPTLKMKRNACSKRFATEIVEMYNKS